LAKQWLCQAAHAARPLSGVAALVVATAVAVPLLAFGGGKATPISLIRLDGHSGRILQTERDASGRGNWDSLRSEGGTLWQYVSQKHQLLERDGRTGDVVHSLSVHIRRACQVALGFGSVSLIGDRRVKDTIGATLTRIDDVSGRIVKRITLYGSTENGTVAAGNGAVWVLESGGSLFRIDPISNRVTHSYATNAVETDTLVPLAA
jgi:hypothetical protein